MIITKISIPLRGRQSSENSAFPHGAGHKDYYFRTPSRSPSKANVIKEIEKLHILDSLHQEYNGVHQETAEFLKICNRWQYVTKEKPFVSLSIKSESDPVHLSLEVINIIDIIPE